MNITFKADAYWLKIGPVAICVFALALLPLPAMAAVAVPAVIGSIIFWNRNQLVNFWSGIKALWPLLIVLILFYFSPYTDVAPSMRGSAKYLSIYSYFGGGFSLMTVVLIAALAIIFISGVKSGKANLAIGTWRGIGLFFCLITISFVIGLLHADGGFLHYGVTEFKRPLIAFMPPLYMLAVFILATNTIRSREHAQRLLQWLDRLNVLLILYGLYRLFMILRGDLETMWMFGLPILLYDQMALFYMPIFAGVARWALQMKMSKWQWLQLAVMMAFILCSTRRYNYLLLASGVILAMLMSYSIGLLSLRRLSRLFIQASTAFGLAALLLFALAPAFSRGVLTAFESLDLSSRVGQKYGGSIRLAIIENIFANLDRRPYAYVSGFGLGTMWQAIERQPMDPLTKKLRRNDGWYTQFSLPYVSLLFRLGVAGTVVLLFWLFFYLRSRLRALRFIDKPFQPYALGMIACIFLMLPAVADSLNPTSWILCGLYMAILERLAAAAPQPLASMNHEAQHHSS